MYASRRGNLNYLGRIHLFGREDFNIIHHEKAFTVQWLLLTVEQREFSTDLVCAKTGLCRNDVKTPKVLSLKRCCFEMWVTAIFNQ